MNKGFYLVVILFIGGVILGGCVKRTPYTSTTNPSLTANIDKYTFVAGTVVTAILDTQIYDTFKTLVITGNTSDRAHPYDKIQLSITKFKGTTGVFSIVQSQAGATYFHYGGAGLKTGRAIAGVVAITSYTSNTINGYFSFDTDDTVHVRNGAFVANRP